MSFCGFGHLNISDIFSDIVLSNVQTLEERIGEDTPVKEIGGGIPETHKERHLWTALMIHDQKVIAFWCFFEKENIKKQLKEGKYTQNKRRKTWGRGKINNFNSQAFQQTQKSKTGCSWRWNCRVPLSIAPKDLVTKQGSIWKHTGSLVWNCTVSQASRGALYFYLSHKKQVLISHGKTVT